MLYKNEIYCYYDLIFPHHPSLIAKIVNFIYNEIYVLIDYDDCL